jgi:hypothetical protein
MSDKKLAIWIFAAIVLAAVVAPVVYVAAGRVADQAIGQAAVAAIVATFTDAAVVLWG